MLIKGILVEIADYRTKEREIHSLLVGQPNYNSNWYCGANGIDIQTKSGKAIIPCIDIFESFLNSKGVFFDNLDLSIIKQNDI